MSKRIMTTNPLTFRIQLLSSNCVVLVEEPSHESEIFLPQLMHGRIALENVVNGRQRRLRESKSNLNINRSKHNYPSQRLAGGQQKLTTATVGLAPLYNMDTSNLVHQQQQQQKNRDISYVLKLILNGNVVLVECNGYESEIFLPHIYSHCIAMKRVTANELVQVQNARKRSSPASSSYMSNECCLYTPAGFTGCIPVHATNQGNRMVVHPIQLLESNRKPNPSDKEQVLKTSRKGRKKRSRMNQSQHQLQKQSPLKQSGAGDQKISLKCLSTKAV